MYKYSPIHHDRISNEILDLIKPFVNSANSLHYHQVDEVVYLAELTEPIINAIKGHVMEDGSRFITIKQWLYGLNDCPLQQRVVLLEQSVDLGKIYTLYIDGYYDEVNIINGLNFDFTID